MSRRSNSVGGIWGLGSEAPSLGPKRAGQEGYVLLGVLFLVFMVMITLSIAAARMAASIERDREVELQHRAKQYRRAIKMYYKKFGAYPPTLDALEKQNEIRFLRRRYKDPITGKADWKLIQFGQNKMPTVWGFFGQPMAGSSMAGIGPGASANGGLFGNNTTGSSAFGSSTFGSSGATGIGGTSSGSMFGSNSGSSNSGSSSGSTGSGSTDSSGNSSGSSGGTSGSSGSSSGSSGSSTDSGSGSGSSGSSFGGNGQTFGGAGIIGVESVSPKKAILEYHKKQHFNEWEFVYDPMQDQMMLSNNTNIGTPVGGVNSSGTQTPGTFTNQPVGGSIPAQQQSVPTQPSTPQQ